MRTLYFFLLLSGTTFAQGSARRDSMPTERAVPPSQRMPIVRPQNEFYRQSGDNPNVVRATLDNMPVWMSDTSSVWMPTKGTGPEGEELDEN